MHTERLVQRLLGLAAGCSVAVTLLISALSLAFLILPYLIRCPNAPVSR